MAAISRDHRLARAGKLAASACLLALLLSLLPVTPLQAPLRAHAWFDDVAKSYPATQDLGSFDAPIYGNELPNGSYQVTARTTSRMCIMYLDPSNAEARNSKELAIINVQDGNIVAMFYISPAYTHLYWGTADEAAAATDSEGTDPSAYIAGSPDEDYVPHMFSLPITALNTPMTISTFSGGDGDKGWEDGSWYTREFIFMMTEAELKEIINGNDDNGSGDQDPPPGGDEDTDSSDDDDDTKPEEPPEQPALNDNAPSDAGGETVASTSSGQQSGDGSGSSGAASPGAQQAQEGIRGVRMNIVGKEPSFELEVDEVEGPTETQKPLLTPQQILALVALGVFVVGVAVRTITFSRGYERGAPRPTDADERDGG